MRQFNQKRALTALLAPALMFIALFFLFPLLFVLLESFRFEGAFTVQRYWETLTSEQLHTVYLRTLKLGLIVTPLAALLAYPAAYYISRMKSGRRSLLMSLIILPLMTSPVARTYAWLVILGRFGLINQTARAMRLIAEPMRLLYTEQAIVLGLLQLFLPLMVLTLVSAMENIPEELEEAALSLGANRLVSFFKVIVPLSADGLVLGGTLVFTGCITAYVTPAILGGTRVLTLSTLLHQQSMVMMNWGSATVIAVIMVATTLILYTLLRLTKPKTA